MSILRSNTFYFILFLLLNLVLRSAFISHAPLSYDEMVSIRATQEDFGHVKHMSEWDNNPPFYYYCLWVWLRIFPISVVSARLLSIIFSSVAIALCFLLFRKKLGFLTALCTCSFLSLCNFITFYSHDSRVYTLVILLGIISTMLFFRFIEKPSWPVLISLALVNFLIVYSHYIAALIVVCQYAYVLFFGKKSFVKIFVFHSAIVLALIFLRFTKKQFLLIFNFNSKGDFWLKPAGFHDLLSALNEMFFPVMLLTAVAILAMIGFISSFRTLPKEQLRFLLYCFMAGPFCILFLYLIGTFKSVFLPRYLIFTIPFFIALSVFLISQVKYAGPFLAGIIALLPLLRMDLHPMKGMQYKPIAKAIKDNYNGNSAMIVNTRDNVNLLYYYLDYNNFIKFKNHDSIFASNRMFGLNDTSQINDINYKQFKTIYLVQSFNTKHDGVDPFQKFLASRYRQIYHTGKFHGAEFTVYTN